MTLPHGWEETPNEWRYRIREPNRFVRIRPKKLRGIRGVYLVGGPFVPGDREEGDHGRGAWVEQAVRFKKTDWTFPAALGWVETHYTRRDNPGSIVDAIRPGDRVTIVNRFGQERTGRAVMRSSYGGWVLNMGGPHGTPGLADESNIVRVKPAKRQNPPARGRRGKYSILTVPEQHQLRIAKQTLQLSDAGARIMGGMTKDEARAIIRRYLGEKAVEYYDAPPRENPDGERRRVLGGKYELEEQEPHVGPKLGTVRQFVARGKRGATYGGYVYPDGRWQWVNLQRKLGTVPFDLAQISPATLWRDAGAEAGERISRKTVEQEFWIERSTDAELADTPDSPYRMVTTGGQRFALSALDAIRAQKQGLEFRGTGAPPAYRTENPPQPSRGAERIHALNQPIISELHKATGEWREAYQAMLQSQGLERLRLSIELEALQERIAHFAERIPHEGAYPEQNPPEGEHPATGRAAHAAMQAIEQLVARQGELSAAIAQIREKADRKVLPEPWEFDRLEGAKLALERAQLAVKQAVGRHGAVVEEFHVELPARRRNPPRGGAREARELYREFHGIDPKHAQLRRIPDLTRLVQLGPALEVHYRPAQPRGPRNTPYRHEFQPGAQLLAPPGGGALVILGPNIRVSRAPRGRFGYIRG